MPKKLFWHLKCLFLATNIEQHVDDLSTYVAHFGILVAHLGVFKAKLHRTSLGCENFCFKAFMKLIIENAINILSF